MEVAHSGVNRNRRIYDLNYHNKTNPTPASKKQKELIQRVNEVKGKNYDIENLNSLEAYDIIRCNKWLFEED